MQLIPGIINVSDNEDQIVVRPADVPQVTLTKQIAVMIHGADPHAFVITKSGVAKYSHLVEMLNRQVSACFRGQAAAEHALHNSMAVSAPEPAATSQPLQQAPYTFRLCTVGKNVIKVYTPTHGRHIYRAVLYLSGTQSEDAPVSEFTGAEEVYVPQHVNTGNHPWKNPVPDWTPTFYSQMAAHGQTLSDPLSPLFPLLTLQA